MASYRLFDQAPEYSTAEWHKDRAVSDHIHEAAHRGRLVRALADVTYLLDFDQEAKTVGDFGCGNGGMLWMLKQRMPDIKTWGYDISPLAVEWATEKYGVNATLVDFPNDPHIKVPDIAVLTETLEHLVDPPDFLKRLKHGGVRWIVASSPMWEDDQNHYEFHLWAWDSQGFKKLFADAGYYILAHYGLVGGAAQHIIVLNRESLIKPLPIAP
jgi:trans-aconitate methyltransferase